MSKKSSNFAAAFEKKHTFLPNCVMVALQILVLSVWVRVLVRQHEKKDILWVSFLLRYRTLPRFSHIQKIYFVTSALPQAGSRRIYSRTVVRITSLSR